MDLDTDPSTTHPNPQPNLHHRKVDLQSTHDLTYLQSNLAKSAQQKLDLHFPKISKPATHISLDGRRKETTKIDTKNTKSNDDKSRPGTQEHKKVAADDNDGDDDGEEEEEEEEDPMCSQVRDLLSEFLQTLWTSAGQNISVNGIDATSLSIPHAATLSRPPPNIPPPSATSSSSNPPQRQQSPKEEIEGIHFTYSPFDPALQHQLASLHGELETLTAQVSRLRRTAPSEGSAATQARLQEVLRRDQMRYDDDDDESVRMDISSSRGNGKDEDETQGMQVDGVRPGWNEDVREVYARGIEELAGLAGTNARLGLSGGEAKVSTLTETVGRAQRANRVAMELE